MKNIKLIFENVNEKKIDIKNKTIIINLSHECITSKTLRYLVEDIKFLKKFKFCKKEVIINFGNTRFADKITYLILDSILYDFLKNTSYSLRISMKVNLRRVHNIGFVGTALHNCLSDNSLINKRKFLKEYEKKYYSNKTIYRRFLTHEELNKNNRWPSIVCSDLGIILKDCLDDEEWIDSISETVSELLCNVISHTDGDCIIHIDISKSILNKKSDNTKYNCVNIGIINFSENRLFDKIKENIKEEKYKKDDLLYNKIYKAYETHKKLFDSNYDDNDFFFITAFQNRVTSRRFQVGNNGTGLTNLIEAIIDKTDDSYSYVLSGENVIFFNTRYLALNEDKFIGFNEQNNYFKYKPSKEIIGRSDLYIPGSIYHLLLIKEC